MRSVPYHERPAYFNNPELEITYYQAITHNAINSLQFQTVLFLVGQVHNAIQTAGGFRKKYGFSMVDFGAQRGDMAGKICLYNHYDFLNTPITVHAVDVAEIAVAAGRVAYPQFTWHQCDMLDFVAPHKFNLALCLNTWYYLDEAEQTQMIEKLDREILAANGYFIISFGIDNLHKLGAEPEGVLENINTKLEMVSQIRTLEKIPLLKINPDFHTNLGRWYWTALYRLRG